VVVLAGLVSTLVLVVMEQMVALVFHQPLPAPQFSVQVAAVEVGTAQALLALVKMAVEMVEQTEIQEIMEPLIQAGAQVVVVAH
jgi:hypothetical protein